MAKSILQNEQECFFCKTTKALHQHHVVNGGGNRMLSEDEGIWVYLCAKHHDRVHQDQKLDEALKSYAQKEYEKTHTHEEWMSLFHKNYL